MGSEMCIRDRYNSRRESSNRAELEGVALISSTMNRSDEWFIDSAATKHMTNDRSIVKNYVQYDQPKDIYLGDSTVIHALGEGKVRLPTVNNTVMLSLTCLKYCLYQNGPRTYFQYLQWH